MSSRTQSKLQVVTPSGSRSRSKTAQGASTALLKDSAAFRSFFGGLMAEVAAGRLSPNVVNAACNAAGKLIKMVELEYRLGNQKESRRATIQLT